MKKQYEYKIVEADRDKWKIGIAPIPTETLLTGFGLEGWELIQVFPNPTASGRTTYLLILKREMPAEE